MHESLQQRGILSPGTVPLTGNEEKQDLMYAASLYQKVRLKELDAVASRLANTEDSISHMDSNTPVLDAGSYERLLSIEASLAALFDSSPGMAERRRSAVQSLKRPSIPNVARDKLEWLSVFLTGCRPLRTRWRLWQRRVSRRGQTTLFSRV